MNEREFDRVAFAGLDGVLRQRLYVAHSTAEFMSGLRDTGAHGVWGLYLVKFKDGSVYVGHSQHIRNRLVYGGDPKQNHSPHKHLHWPRSFVARLFGSSKGEQDWRPTVDVVVWREAENGTVLETLKRGEMTARRALTKAGFKLLNISPGAGGSDAKGKYRSPLD